MLGGKMEVLIEKLDHNGRGIGYISKKIIFVPKTVVGDLVDVELTLEKKNYSVGKALNIIKKSSKRINVVCPYFEVCGGCDLLNISYEDTLKYKVDKVKGILKKVNVEPTIIKNENEFYYRNKIELKVIDGKIGFYEEKTHNVVKIYECLIASKAINECIFKLKLLNIINGSITLRSNYNNELLIVIESNDDLKFDINKFLKGLKVVGIVKNNETIYGENFLYEMINNYIFKISYNSFFQVNSSMASNLFKIISDSITPESTVLDLYCGVGSLSIVEAKKAFEVIGIEIVPNAVINAIENARINKCNNVSFLLNDVENAIGKIAKKIDVVVVDPPRKGLDTTTLNTLLKEKPSKIIYVSCDPLTLGRDLDKLLDIYNIEKYYILDMFSYTYHVECVCVLELNKEIVK
ncbi:MAG: class I SAM-dependent RNA methyltransferase [Bacilli bacterium]